jgi:RNA polymerase sigma-70 factor, ECF subfamily
MPFGDLAPLAGATPPRGAARVRRLESCDVAELNGLAGGCEPPSKLIEATFGALYIILHMEAGEVQGAFAMGSSQWPEVRLSIETFERYLPGVIGDPPAPDWARNASDLYLCCGCVNGSSVAQRILDTHFLAALAKSVARIKADDDFIQETLQELRTKLLLGPNPRILAYSGRGPLLGWLRVIATRLALDALRSDPHPRQAEDALERLASLELDPLSGVLKARYAPAFQQALQEALHTLSERDRQLLRLRLVDSCGIDRLGSMYQVDRATAARWLKSARDRVFRRVRQKLGALYGLTHQEFQSMARIMLSQLEMRHSALFDASLTESASAALQRGVAPPDTLTREREDDH